jgi:short-subunit dehydrogenase
MTTDTRKTALVTGASAGLGAQFAQLAAQDGYHVIVVARAKDRLEQLAARLEAAHPGVRVHVVPADLADPAAPQRVFDAVAAKGLTVDVLVNNAGFGTNGAFLDLPLEPEAAMVEVNCNAVLKLTHLFARPMRARGFGRILNIASTAGFQAGPFMATYYATKAFVVSFSEALAVELEGTGVTVTASCPGATATEFSARSGNDKSRLFTMQTPASAEAVAREAWAAMHAGRVLKVHGFLNWLGVVGAQLGPRSVARSLARGMNLPAK